MEVTSGLRGRLDPEQIDAVISRLDARLDEIISQLIEMYRVRIPSYAAAPPEFMDEVYLGTTTSYQVGLQILRGEVDPGLIRAPLEELGRTRARQGIPLGDALLAWQISVRTFWRYIAEFAPDEPEARADVMLLASDVIMELLEQAVSAISSGYLDVERARVADEEFDSQTVVETLAGARPRDQLFASAAARLGVDLATLDSCVVGEVRGDDVGSSIRTFRSRLSGALVGRIGEFVVAFCSDVPVSDDSPPTGVASAGSDGAGYAHARAALKVALALNMPVARYEDVAPLALILDAPAADRAAFVEAQLGPVLGDASGAELLRSLAAYYSAGQSIAAAARELHVHRHTLEYRLERLERLLGERLKDPTGRLLLELALTLHHQPGTR